MSDRPGARRQFRFAWRNKRQVATDVDAELAFHLARRIEELMERGLSADEARREAATRFGNLEYTRQYCRDEDVRRERETRHTTMIDELKQDLIYALRSLRSAPGFAFVALLTLALGIGANTAIFSVVRGVLLSPLPFPDADRVIRIWHVNPSENEGRSQSPTTWNGSPRPSASHQWVRTGTHRAAAARTLPEMALLNASMARTSPP